MSRKLIRQLKKLKHEAVNPRGEWTSQNREILLSQIKNTLPATPAPLTTEARLEKFWAGMAVFLPRPVVYNFVRPIAVLILVSLIATTAYSGTVKASAETLPGDFLYPAKRAAERTQGAVISLVGDNNDETKYHVNLAQRRASEVKQIVAIKKNDPKKVARVAATVADLKIELQSINEKLANTVENKDIQAGVAKDVKQDTEAIKDVLQGVKEELALTMSVGVAEKDLAKEVNETKDLVKDVSVNAVEAMVEKHLSGDKTVSIEEVQEVLDISIAKAANDVLAIEQVVNGAQTIVETVKTQVKDLEAEIKKQKIGLATSTKEFSEQLTDVASSTKDAVVKAQEASVDIDKKLTEAKVFVDSGELTKAVDKLKEMTEASKEAEKNSDITIEKAQGVLPIVQVIKDANPTAVTTSSSTLPVTSTTKEITSLFSSTTLVAPPLAVTPTMTVKVITTTVITKPPSTTEPVKVIN